MLSPKEVVCVIDKMMQLQINAVPLPTNDQSRKFWRNYLEVVDPADALQNGHYHGQFVYAKVHSTFVSSKLSFKLADKSAETLIQFIKQQWYSQPMLSTVTHKQSFGQTMEPMAKALYAERTACTVKQCKHVINPKIPFLICSPDGLVFNKEQFKTAIEIKTITDIHTTDEFYKLRCCKKQGKNWVMQKDAPMYAQMQFTMIALNLQEMDLVLFFPHFTDILVLSVERDHDFLNKYLRKLYQNYVRFVIPHLMSKLAEHL